MRKSLIAATLTLAAALALPAAAQNPQTMEVKTPGAVGMARTAKLTATIVAVDSATREVTLKGPKGNEMTVTAGPEVTNFSKLKAGDKVDVQYIEALVVELKKGGGLPIARTEDTAMGKAKPGATPGAVAGRQVTIVGEVTGLDPSTQTITVRGPRQTIDLPIRDADQFKLIAKGDQLQATYTEGLAVSVTPQ